MQCTVHCLVSGREELEPLFDRIDLAGIPRERVFVAWRNPAGGCCKAPVWNEEGLCWNGWQGLLGPAAWWWTFATGSWYPARKRTSPSVEADVSQISAFAHRGQR